MRATAADYVLAACRGGVGAAGWYGMGWDVTGCRLSGGFEAVEGPGGGGGCGSWVEGAVGGRMLSL